MFLSGRGTGDVMLIYLSCHGVLDRRGRLRHFLLKQAGALGDRPRGVGGDPIHRVVVGPEDILPAQHRL
jgi:hypothetical protein